MALATTTVPTPEQLIESFPIKSLTKIHGPPSFDDIYHLQKQLRRNASSVPCELGGGQHGYLYLTTLTDAAYTGIQGTAAWVNPVHPGPLTQLGVGVTNQEIAFNTNRHAERLRIYHEWQNVQAALKLQLLQAVDEKYFKTLENQHTGLSNVSLRQMLNHLLTNYGQVEPVELEEKLNQWKQAWDPTTGIEQLYKQIEDGVALARLANQPHSDSQVLSNAYSLVYKTGLFFSDCEKWMEKAAADKTWDNFKLHFMKAMQKHKNRETITAKQAGYGQANNINNENIANALNHFALAAQEKDTQLANLTAQMIELQKQLNDKNNLLAEFMKSQQWANKNNNPPPNARPFKDNGNYCWSHGYVVGNNHTSGTCKNKKPGHKDDATRANTMGGSDAGKHRISNSN